MYILFLYAAICIVGIVLQGSVTMLPLILALLLPLIIFFRSPIIFFLAFVGGIILDTELLRPFGQTGLFLVVFLFLVLLYDRKFEINSYPFVFFASCIGSAMYLIIFHNRFIIPASLITACVALLAYRTLRYTIPYTRER